MPAIVLIGAQWGDEGKGKATDLLAGRVDYVVKFNGGNNAGHTVVIGDKKFALHLLPSGILSPGVVPVIANGTVVDLEVLFSELEALTARGVDVSRLRISANAHVITQYHRTIDKVTERFLGKRQIGTTGRGIGPTYADKINRVGIRIQDLFDEGILRQKVEGALDQKNHLLRQGLQPPCDRGRRGRRGPPPVRRAAAPDGRGHRARAEHRARRRADGPVRGRPGDDARRRPRHVPVRHLLERDERRGRDRVGRRAEPHGAGDRGRQGVHDPRRRRPVPDRAATTRRGSGCARRASSSARPPAGRAAPAGSMRRSRATRSGSTA